MSFFCICIRVFARKLASPFGHPTQVCTQVQLASTCDYLPVLFAKALDIKRQCNKFVNTYFFTSTVCVFIFAVSKCHGIKWSTKWPGDSQKYSSNSDWNSQSSLLKVFGFFRNVKRSQKLFSFYIRWIYRVYRKYRSVIWRNHHLWDCRSRPQID